MTTRTKTVGRPCVVRPCQGCGAASVCAMQIKLRKLGPGMSKKNTMSMSVFFCGECMRRPQAECFTPLATDAVTKAYKPAKPRGPGLFPSSAVVQ